MTEQFNQQRAVPIVKMCNCCGDLVTVWHDPATNSWPEGNLVIERHYAEGRDLVAYEICPPCLEECQPND